jgi:NAD(P)-dependent dehydrogenase (short-subunit alcohol dehydrogenase family)
MGKSVSEPVVVVTGASAGVGRAVARKFAARGDRVALLARGERGLDAAPRDIEGAGGVALPIALDVADYQAVQQAAQQVQQALGPIDVWVNNAMTSVFARFEDMSPEEFQRVNDVTYMGYVHGTKAALRCMRDRDRGVIVQVGSALAYRGIPLQSAYCGAKHAIQGFTESLRCELLHDRSDIHVTMVQLPAVNTPQFDWVLSRLPRRSQPVPPIYQPELAAEAIVFAADHPQRREYWVGTSTVATLIADKLAPGLLDHYLARKGFASQQTEQPRDPGMATDLWEPVDDAEGEDFGEHGRFDRQSRGRSLQLWASQHHGTLGAAAVGAAAALWAVMTQRR